MRPHVPPREDLPDLERCLALGKNPNDPDAPLLKDRKPMAAQPTSFTPNASPVQSYDLVPVGVLDESPTNPRKTWGNLDELAASIQKVGVLQPLVVTALLDGRHTLVFGHRRLRAAKKAGVELVPVLIRGAMTDQEVLEAQVVENSARTDVHPLEEAEGWERLHTQYGVTAEEIAAKVAKSKASVYARLKLLALIPSARKAFYDGLLDASKALYLARIPHPELQKEALKELLRKDYRGDLPSAREAQEMIRRRFMLRLKEAPFDKGDANLVAGAGACKDCPKRTGNQPELFGDVDSADVCTDPVCWDQKRIAGVADKAERLVAKGVAVVEGVREARHGDRARIEAPPGYARLTDYDAERHATWTQVAKAHPDHKKVVMFDEEAHAVDLVRKADFPKNAPSSGKGHDDAASAKRSKAAQVQREKEALARAKVKKALRAEISRALLKIAPDEAWRLVLFYVKPYKAKVLAEVQKKRGAPLVAGVLDLLLDEDYHDAADDPESLVGKACALFGLDWKAREEAALEAVRPQKDGKTAKADAPKKGSAKKKGLK